ncbi:hypothetical protein HDU80_005976 [Chytriomyces hyalinus]|nr:hypothetical protein HDU80_005976 [Chytriomyces hyalinus]
MLGFESFSIPADAPEPFVRTSLFTLLWNQQQQQQQQQSLTAAIAHHRLVSTANSAPHVRSNSTHTAPSPQPSEACSPASVGSPGAAVHGQGLPPRSDRSNDPFVALKHAAVQIQTRRPRKTSLRGVAGVEPLDACQLKKLQKAERKKRREMNRKLVCFNCAATSSPIWRRTLDRKNNICNACGLYFKNHKCHKPVRTAPAFVAPVPAALSSPATEASDQLPTPEPASDTFLDDFLNFNDGSTELSHDVAAAFLPFSTSLLPSAGAESQGCFTIPHAADHSANNTLSLEIQQFLQPLVHFPPHLPSEYSAVAGVDLTFGGMLWSSQEC